MLHHRQVRPENRAVRLLHRKGSAQLQLQRRQQAESEQFWRGQFRSLRGPSRHLPQTVQPPQRYKRVRMLGLRVPGHLLLQCLHFDLRQKHIHPLHAHDNRPSDNQLDQLPGKPANLKQYKSSNLTPSTALT